MSELEQAKRRDKKIYITEIAIEKVPHIQYLGFDNDRNEIMRLLAQNVLRASKEMNDSNEVAFTCDLGIEDPLDQIGVSFGTEHEIDIFSDTLSNHLIVSEKSIAVVVLHNHPSTQTFSLQDISFFLKYTAIEVIVVVSNQGTVHYLMRDKDFDLKRAYDLFGDCIEGLNPDTALNEFYLAALSFLAKCSEAGLYYR